MASIISVDDIQLGLGDLEIGAFVNGSFVSYRSVGAIRGEAMLTFQRETVNYQTGRPLMIVKREVVRELVTFAFRMSEITVANLKDMLGDPGTTSSGQTPTFLTGNNQALLGDLTDSMLAVTNADIFTIGGSCNLNRAALRFTHRKQCGAVTKRQIVEIFRATPTGALATPFREADWNESEVTFDGEADLTRPAGQQLMQFINEV